jgi:hypothetical protein
VAWGRFANPSRSIPSLEGCLSGTSGGFAGRVRPSLKLLDSPLEVILIIEVILTGYRFIGSRERPREFRGRLHFGGRVIGRGRGGGRVVSPLMNPIVFGVPALPGVAALLAAAVPLSAPQSREFCRRRIVAVCQGCP